MHAQTPKQDALHAIERLPDDVPLDEIVYRLYVLSKVQRGLKDIDAGRTVSAEELVREIEAW
jgi:predicted transcriptional regulator